MLDFKVLREAQSVRDGWADKLLPESIGPAAHMLAENLTPAEFGVSATHLMPELWLLANGRKIKRRRKFADALSEFRRQNHRKIGTDGHLYNLFLSLIVTLY